MPPLSRRSFLAQSSSCAAHLALCASALPGPLRDLWHHASKQATARYRVIAREPFGTLHEIAAQTWALVSDPFHGDRTTLCNGALVAGKNAVLAIEGFYTPAGATWLAEQSKRLTGRWPTHVALTHYHADHTNGVAGYLPAAVPDEAADARLVRPAIRATAVTRDQSRDRNTPADASRAAALADVVLLDAAAPSTLDLGGGRVVRIVPRDGHTASDIVLELDEPGIVFAGDLLWNGIFPNYVDAMPSRLSRNVRALRRVRETTYVPGHGAIASAADVDRYLAMLDEVEHAARAAHAAGTSAADAGKAFKLSPALGEWALFGAVFFQRAFEAWYRELP